MASPYGPTGASATCGRAAPAYHERDILSKMVSDQRPGLDSRRLARLMEAAIGRLELKLGGHTVLTEAATGAYAVTPVLAAMAGARVFALANATRYASATEIEEDTLGLAAVADVRDSIELVYEKNPTLLGRVDIVTNSGQVRPIDKTMISYLKPTCVVPLMYEAWEYRRTDVDVSACLSSGISVAGTNERHPAVDVFSYLGVLAVRQLHDAGVAVHGSHITLLCDNDFGPFIMNGLEGCGAMVSKAQQLTLDALVPQCDAIVVALKPRDTPVLTAADAHLLRRHAPGTVVAQYWGDIDRAALARAGVPVWPPEEPVAGHMAVFMSAVGPEPVVRLQAGGLKVGEVLARGLDFARAEDHALVQPLWPLTTLSMSPACASGRDTFP
jgi:hypothetical protein